MHLDGQDTFGEDHAHVSSRAQVSFLLVLSLCGLDNMLEVSTRKYLEVTILNYALHNTDSLAKDIL